MTIDIPEGYESLGLALGEAVAQASRGKGAERHAEFGEAFSDQLIFEIPRRLGACGSGFLLGQAVKKIYESARLEPERARAEILGAINYLAAAWSRQGGEEGAMKKWASRQIANNGVVSAPEAPKAAGNVCLDFAERVVSLMKEMGVREVSFAVPGARICADGTVTGLHFTTDAADGSGLKDAEALCRRIREANPSVYAPEDADVPRFQKGEPVEYRLPDGTWAPADFVCMDGGYAVLECGGPRFSVLAFEVRPAEPVPSAPEDADETLFAAGGPEKYAVGERVKYAVQGKWEPAVYVGVDPAGKHVVSVGSSYIHLDGSLVRKA